MKNILHIQIDTEKNKPNYIGAEMLGNFVKLLRNQLGDDFIVIASPGRPELYGEEFKLYNFEVSQLSKEELLNFVNKS
jgi:hypothetical protein